MNKFMNLSPLERWLAYPLLKGYIDVLTPRETRREIRYHFDKETTRLIEKTNQDGFVDLEKLYLHRKILKVEVKEKSELGDKLGLLRAIKKGLLVDVREDLKPLSKRMTLAHEIGHTFLYDLDDEIPHMPYTGNTWPLTREENYIIQERYADEIGKLILVPKKFREQIIEDNKIDSIEFLDNLKLGIVSNSLKVYTPLLKGCLKDYINYINGKSSTLMPDITEEEYLNDYAELIH